MHNLFIVLFAAASLALVSCGVFATEEAVEADAAVDSTSVDSCAVEVDTAQ